MWQPSVKKTLQVTAQKFKIKKAQRATDIIGIRVINLNKRVPSELTHRCTPVVMDMTHLQIHYTLIYYVTGSTHITQDLHPDQGLEPFCRVNTMRA